MAVEITILFIIQVILLCLLTGWVSYNYFIYHYNFILYLLIALVLMLLSGFYEFFSSVESEVEVVSLSILAIIQIVSLYLILLFISSFETETVRTKTNIALGAIMIFIAAAFFVLSLIMRMIVLDLEIKSFETFFGSSIDISVSQLMTAVLFLVFAIGNLLLVFILSITILKKLIKKIKNTTNEEVKKILVRITISIGLLILGPFILGIFSVPGTQHSGSLVVTISLGMLFHFYRQGGVFLLQSDSLRSLLIINESGIPLYSYLFNKFPIYKEATAKQAENYSNKEVLFSGALKAISNLLKEFTGAEQDIREIVLDELKLILKHLDNTNNSIVLVTDSSSKFFKEALEGFTESFSEKSFYSSDMYFNSKQKEETDELVKEHFGIS